VPLEQIGTYANCTGRARYGGFEALYPAQAGPLNRIKVHPEDEIAARIVVLRRAVRMTLRDRTGGVAYSQDFPLPDLNTTSAEWIVKSPASVCRRYFYCQRILPLANFGSATFSQSEASVKGGRLRPIDASPFSTTRLFLHDRPGVRIKRKEQPTTLGSLGEASPGALSRRELVRCVLAAVGRGVWSAPVDTRIGFGT
jgi:Peptidase A4 family